MNKIFVTSDIWFNRPNSNMSEYSINEYNEMIINKWNETVGKKDIVYILGGLGVSDVYHLIVRLNGEIHILNNFYTQDEIYFKDDLKVCINKSIDKNIQKKIIFENNQIMILPKQDVVLSYFPLLEWYGFNYGTYLFNGFTQTSDLESNKISCFMENWDYKPLQISEIKKNIEKIKKNL